MRLYKCDRCGCVFDSIERSKLELTGDETREADLCTSCRVDFIRWLNGDPRGMGSVHALEVIRKLRDEMDTVENIPDYGRKDRAEFKFGYRNGCLKAIELLEDGSSEAVTGSAESLLAPPGTFEWVLARVRQGAPWEVFRRAKWMEGRHMILSESVCGPSLRVASVDPLFEPFRMTSTDILATDWEEIPPKEESE